MTDSQWRQLPQSLASVVAIIAFLDPPDANLTLPSSPSSDKFEAYWRYLNTPLITAPEKAETGHSIAELDFSRRVATQIRATLSGIYQVLQPLLLITGLMALVVASVVSITIRAVKPVLVVALAAWTLVATRTLLLGVVDISSFPSATYPYVAPAAYLAVLAAILSIGAFVALPVGRYRVR